MTDTADGVTVAVATSDWSAVAGHAGRARKWLLFEVSPEGAIREAGRIELAPEQVFHHHKEGPHPLAQAQVLIAASAGEGFARHAQKLGLQSVLTSEPDARKAVADFIAHTLADPKSMGILGLACKLRDLFSPH